MPGSSRHFRGASFRLCIKLPHSTVSGYLIFTFIWLLVPYKLFLRFLTNGIHFHSLCQSACASPYPQVRPVSGSVVWLSFLSLHMNFLPLPFRAQIPDCSFISAPIILSTWDKILVMSTLFYVFDERILPLPFQAQNFDYSTLLGSRYTPIRQHSRLN